jgi:hypothetical protein
LKLSLSLVTHFFHGQPWAAALDSEIADLIVSIITASFFFVPIITSRAFGWPAARKEA